MSPYFFAFAASPTAWYDFASIPAACFAGYMTEPSGIDLPVERSLFHAAARGDKEVPALPRFRIDM